MLQPKRLSVKGGKGFTSSGIAKTTKIQMPKMSSKPIVTQGISEKLQSMDKKAPFGNRYFLGQKPKQFGVFPKLRKKSMKKTASSFKLKVLARKYFPGVGQFSKGSLKVKGSEFLKKKEWPETGATTEFFNILDGQKQYLKLLKSKKRFKDKSLEEIREMLKAEGKRDQRIGTLKAGTTLSIPALGYYGKKSMDKKAFRMPRPKLLSPNRGTFRMKKPRPRKARVPNFMKKIVGFQQLPTYKPPKSGMTKYLKKRFKF